MSNQMKILRTLCECTKCTIYGRAHVIEWHSMHSSESLEFYMQVLRGDRALAGTGWLLCKQLEYSKTVTRPANTHWTRELVSESESDPIAYLYYDAKRRYGIRIAVECVMKIVSYLSFFSVGDRSLVNSRAVEIVSFLSQYEQSFVRLVESWYTPDSQLANVILSGNINTIESFTDYLLASEVFSNCSQTLYVSITRDLVDELFPDLSGFYQSVLPLIGNSMIGQRLTYFSVYYACAASLILETFDLSFEYDWYHDTMVNTIRATLQESGILMSDVLSLFSQDILMSAMLNIPFEPECSIEESSYEIDNVEGDVCPSDLSFDFSSMFLSKEFAQLSHHEAYVYDAENVSLELNDDEVLLDMRVFTDLLTAVNNTPDPLLVSLPQRADNQVLTEFLYSSETSFSLDVAGEYVSTSSLKRPSNLVCVIDDQFSSTLAQALYSVLPTTSSLVLLSDLRIVELDTGPKVVSYDSLEEYMSVHDSDRYHVYFSLSLTSVGVRPSIESHFPFVRGEKWSLRYVLPHQSPLVDTLLGCPYQVESYYYDQKGVDYMTGEAVVRVGTIHRTHRVQKHFCRLLIPKMIVLSNHSLLMGDTVKEIVQNPTFAWYVGRAMLLHCAMLGYVPSGPSLRPHGPQQPGCWKCETIKVSFSKGQRHFCVACGSDYFLLKDPPGQAYESGCSVSAIPVVRGDFTGLFL